MIPKLSINAQKSFDEYINQVRLLLRFVKSVDAEEIVQNINEHIENELADAAEPIGSDELEDVLRKLGSPQQWVPEEEIPWWKKFILRLRSGPEDWRLTYLSFGLLIAGFIFLPLFLVFLAASYLVARAALSLSDYNLQVKEQRWLLYPSLIIVNVFLLLALLLWPLIISINIGYIIEPSIRHSIQRFQDDFSYWFMVCSFIIASLGLWWLIFANIIVQKLFSPFDNLIQKKTVLRLWFVGLLITIIFSIIGILCWL